MVLWDRDTANETSLRGFMALNTIKLICGFGSRLPMVFAKVSSESTESEQCLLYLGELPWWANPVRGKAPPHPPKSTYTTCAEPVCTHINCCGWAQRFVNGQRACFIYKQSHEYIVIYDLIIFKVWL